MPRSFYLTMKKNDAVERRQFILNEITTNPISATALAKSLGVSRQVIVGDVALLRASGNDIIATARGYILPTVNEDTRFIGTLACFHAPEKTKDELYAIVDHGASVLNIIIEHDVYGEITGNLNLSSRKDVDMFMQKVDSSEVKLLSELTSGIHLHTISCASKKHFNEVYNAVKSMGFLI